MYARSRFFVEFTVLMGLYTIFYILDPINIEKLGIMQKFSSIDPKQCLDI